MLYELTTPFTLKRRTTTMRDAQGRVVGVYERRWSHHSTVTFHGQTTQRSEWLKESKLTGSQTLKAPNGREYAWKSRGLGDSLKLVDKQTDKTVAKAHSAGCTLSLSKRKMNIDLEPELLPFLDTVVFSFAIAEERRRTVAEASAGAADGAAAAVSA